MKSTAAQIFTLIELVAANPSKNAKIQILSDWKKDHPECSMLEEVLEATYNPFKVYGVQEKTAPKIGAGEQDDFTSVTWGLLDKLLNRELTGFAALHALDEEMAKVTPEAGGLLRRILLKDMRAGFSESTTNKVFKGLIPEFPYMRCSLPKDGKIEQWDWAAGVISQEKADGMFTNVNHDVNGIRMTTRQGSPLPNEHFQEIVNFCQKWFQMNSQTHGELLVEVDGEIAPREISNGILNRVLDGSPFLANERPILLIWDQIALAAVKPKGKDETPYFTRLCNIVDQLPTLHSDQHEGNDVVRLIEDRQVFSQAEAWQHYRELLAQGKEGTIIKKRTAIWKDGTSKEQVKLKLAFEVDLEVVAVNEGKGKNAGRPGALRCKTSDGLLVVDVTIKNEAMRDSVEKEPEKFIGSVMEVTSNMVMKPSASSALHSLFLPRFKTGFIRTDKSVADSLERVIAQQEAAVAAA